MKNNKYAQSSSLQAKNDAVQKSLSFSQNIKKELDFESCNKFNLIFETQVLNFRFSTKLRKDITEAFFHCREIF